MSEKTDNLRVPPQDIDAEMSLLGAILQDEEVLTDVADKITATEFYEPNHTAIFSAMIKLYDSNRPVDLLTTTTQLRSEKKLADVGGKAYLAELADYVPNASNAAAYAEIIRNAATRRNYIRVATEIGGLPYNEELSTSEISDQIESLVFHARSDFSGGEAQKFDSLLSHALVRIEKLADNPNELRGVRTGYADLDKKLSGFQKTDLIILAARPGMGKSALAQNFMTNIAVKEKKSVIYFSLEMGKDQLTDRILSAHSHIKHDSIRSGRFQGDEFSKLSESINELEQAPIYIDDKSNLTITELLTKARRIAAKLPKQNELGLIVVDYLQLMSANIPSRDGNRVNEVGEISRGLKLIARDLDVPVLAISQLSRSIESRSDKKPQLSDLRESGSIEQDADIVMFINRDDYYDEDTERANIADLIIAKHRNGEQGKVELYFEPEMLRFSSYAKHK
jgi:replicative DNA helicase